MFNQVGDQQIESAHGPADGEGPPPPAPTGTPFTAQVFRDFLAAQILANHMPAELQRPVLVPSADITKPFHVRAPRVVAGPPGQEL
jgi:hypothetical protein